MSTAGGTRTRVAKVLLGALLVIAVDVYGALAVQDTAFAKEGGNGNHYGQAKEHSNNGHHYGQGGIG